MVRKSRLQAPSLVGKVEAVAARDAALRAEAQRAELGEALVRVRLGDALMEAMAGRARAEAATRAAVWGRYRAAAVAWARPDRRNRLRRLAERVLDRFRSAGRALVIARSGLWRTPRAGAAATLAAVPAMAAYARLGPDANAQPPALIDQAWYIGAYPDVAASGASPLVHYLLRGGAEGRSPHPLFDGAFYVRRYHKDLAATGLTPLEHFVHVGAARGHDPHPLFDIAHYVVQAPELIETGENPLAHYLRVGADQGLTPHLLFDPSFYRHQLLGAEQAANPLVHYLTSGFARGLKPHPLFDPAWYLGRYPDVAGRDPLSHFVEYAGEQMQDPGPWFDSAHYAHIRGGARPSRLDPLSDYLRGGAWTAAEPAEGFHPTAYLAAHPELAARGLTPLEHWARRGV